MRTNVWPVLGPNGYEFDTSRVSLWNVPQVFVAFTVLDTVTCYLSRSTALFMYKFELTDVIRIPVYYTKAVWLVWEEK